MATVCLNVDALWNDKDANFLMLAGYTNRYLIVDVKS